MIQLICKVVIIMNFRIKEIEKTDMYDYMYVHTYSWEETYRGIMDDEFLNKIKKELDQNVERLKINLIGLKLKNLIIKGFYYMLMMNL